MPIDPDEAVVPGFTRCARNAASMATSLICEQTARGDFRWHQPGRHPIIGVPKGSSEFPMSLRSIVAGLLLVAAGGIAAAAETSGSDFFRQHVATIFERHCLACHRNSEANGNLSLAVGLSAFKGGDSGPVIVPGKPEA